MEELIRNVQKKFIEHQGYPRKSYRIKDKKCGHCRKLFKTECDLKNHLQTYHNYIDNFHHTHRVLVDKMNLSKEKIINEKMTKCPSILCCYEFEKPEELYIHFVRLGAMKDLSEGEEYKDCRSEEKYKLEDKIYFSDRCLICYEKEPNVIYINCGHCQICSNCYLTMETKNKCMICRKDNKYIISCSL